MQILSDTISEVSFEFDQVVLYEQEDTEAPLNTGKRFWETKVVLEAGVPKIVGAVQEGDRMVFLVMTADVVKP